MRRTIFLVLAALVTVVLAAGCGDDDPGKQYGGPVAHAIAR